MSRVAATPLTQSRMKDGTESGRLDALYWNDLCLSTDAHWSERPRFVVADEGTCNLGTRLALVLPVEGDGAGSGVYPLESLFGRVLRFRYDEDVRYLQQMLRAALSFAPLALSTLEVADSPESTRRTDDTSSATHELRGPSPGSATELLELLEMSVPEVARLVGVTERGYRNWLSGARIRLANEKRLLWMKQLARLVQSGVGAGKVREWFMTPAIGSDSPYDLICSGRLSEVARLVAAEFERPVVRKPLDESGARQRGFPFDVLIADDSDLEDLMQKTGD